MKRHYTGNIRSILYYAQDAAETAVHTARGADAYDRARNWFQITQLAIREWEALEADLPRMQDAIADSERYYDRYVTSPAECCSCHISPPCGFCVSGADCDEDEN